MIAVLLFGRAEARDHLDLNREGGHAAREGIEVLLGQHGGGHQHGHLLAILDGLEGRAQRHLGLAEADIAADQPIHRLDQLHIVLDVDQRLELIGRLDIREGILQLALPFAIGAEGVALAELALGV